MTMRNTTPRADLYVVEVKRTQDGIYRLLNREPIGKGFAVRLPSGMVHEFPTEEAARASRYWTIAGTVPTGPRADARTFEAKPERPCFCRHCDWEISNHIGGPCPPPGFTSGKRRMAFRELIAEAKQAAHALDVARFDSSMLRAAIAKAEGRE